MADENIYGWKYSDFHSFVGWDKGTQLVYEAWENHWARRIEAYVFTDTSASPRFTDANEVLEIGDIINEMMVQTNIYLKAESSENPMESGFYTGPGFPVFHGDPEANNGKGTGHYAILNKYKRKYSQSEVRVDSLRMGKIPDDNPFYMDHLI